MTFDQAERLYRLIEARYQAGEDTIEQVRAELARLQVVDGRGETWQIQEHTGQWHVYRQGRWQPSTPPRPSAALPRTRPGPPVWNQQQPPAPAAAPTPAAAPPTQQRPARSRLLWIGGAVALLLICGGAICLGGAFYPRLSSWFQRSAALPSGATPIPATVEANPGGDTTFKQTQVDRAPAGAATQDGNGAALFVPPDALDENESALLIAGQIEGPLRRALEGSYTVDTPFYTVTAKGEKGGRGRAHLSLPAPSPGSRMLALIDGAYPALLGVQPQNGELSVDVRLVPRAEDTGHPPTRYAVITPKTTSRVAPGLAAPAAESAIVDCYPQDSTRTILSGCRSDAEGKLIVTYPLAFGHDQAENLVRDLLAVVESYRELGFAAARLSPSSSMRVHVTAGEQDFFYSSKTGIIYTPLKGVALQAGSQGYYAVRHEIAHWIQDEEYVMTWIMVSSGAGTWWLETAADTMVMLADPSYADALLDDQGDLPLAPDENHSLTFQLSPHQWPNELYIHAHQVRFNMCDDASLCPISQSQFVDAINRGLYPFDEAAAQAKMRANLDSYALYLIGGEPLLSSPAMPADTGRVHTGDGYGDEAAPDPDRGGAYRFFSTGSYPNINRKQVAGMAGATLSAPLQPGGVYPLTVRGQKGARPSLPLSLTLRSEAPFWVRRGSDPPEPNDGGEPLVIAPIHNTMGIDTARVVAFTKDQPASVSGEIGVIDLGGAMVIQAGSVRANQIICSGDTGGEDTQALEDQLAMVTAQLLTAATGVGDYEGPTAARLNWQMDPTRLPPTASPDAFQFESSLELQPDHVLVESEFVLPEMGPTTHLPWTSALPLLGVAVVPLPAASLGGKSKRRRFIAVTLLTGLLLSACWTDMRMEGSISSELRFEQIEYLGGRDVPTLTMQGIQGEATPRWRLSEGSGSSVVHIVITVTKKDDDGNEIEESITCAGLVDYDLSAEIYVDLVADLRASSGE